MPEVWVPGSNIPFKPMNPWGRAFPKVPSRPAKPQLWQLFVTRKGKGEIPFGPKMERQFVDQFYEAVLNGIRCGAEQELSSPHIEKVESAHQTPGQKTLRELIMEKI